MVEVALLLPHCVQRRPAFNTFFTDGGLFGSALLIWADYCQSLPAVLTVVPEECICFTVWAFDV